MFSIIHRQILGIEDDDLIMPLTLNPNDILLCKLKCKVYPHPYFETNAQFAVSLSKADSPKEYEAIVEVDCVDYENKAIKFDRKFVISLRPLKDLYFNFWQDADQFELLRLAGIKQSNTSLPKGYDKSIETED